MIYTNPVIYSDYSDPDVIRVNDTYYMVSSSFNHTPGIPVLKSKNLVNWKIIGYVFNNLPSEKYNEVIHGGGAWAPSIRYHDNKFYVSIPDPDFGIYVSECNDIEKCEFSPLRLLLPGKGLEDPCPIWINDKCYMVVGFAKSRAGFNSCLGVYEVSTDLTCQISDTYKIVFDGHNTQPTIEGPKFYIHNGYIYIMAPAGSVKTGWQTALRSKNIYGPYEEKIVMCQNDSRINGPHQGALIDLADGSYAFMHFQDLDCYGRVVHLQPLKWINDWPVPGDVRDELLAGTPYESHDYLINIESDYKIDDSDTFRNDKLSLMWQTPANKTKEFYKLDNGLKLYAFPNDNLNLYPYSLLTKILYKSFNVSVNIDLSNLNDNDEAGLCYMGNNYYYIGVKKESDSYAIRLYNGSFNGFDTIIREIPYNSDRITLKLNFKYPGVYKLGYNDYLFDLEFIATKGRWIGGKYGIFTRGNSNGYSIFTDFIVEEK